MSYCDGRMTSYFCRGAYETIEAPRSYLDVEMIRGIILSAVAGLIDLIRDRDHFPVNLRQYFPPRKV